MSGCCSQSARPLLWKTLFRVIAFSVLAASGGLIFAAVEHPNAVNNLKRKEELLVSLREDMAKKYNMSQDDFDNFIEITDDAFNMAGPSWSYFQSVRFAFETLTTIGYGRLAPSTSLGQALCVVFAVLGIPVTILAFKSVGELISRGISSVITKIERKYFKREPANVAAKSTAVTCVLMVIMLVLGATLQMYTDDANDMTFLEGFYFWFISFSTIGYGDYVPGFSRTTASSQNGEHSKNAARKTANIAFHLTWTTLGLCVVSSALNALAEFMEKRSTAKRLRRKCCSCFKDDSYRVKNCNGKDITAEEENYHSVTYV